MQITNDIIYIGVDDTQIDLFEGQYPVPKGMSYNSYVILDEKVAVMDTVDQNFTQEWLSKLAAALNGRTPDYLVIHHMEPDHSANIANFMNAYPDTVIVANTKTFTMIDNFFHMDLEGRKLVVENNATLSLGRHELQFIFAPMVHWPEVMVTYDKLDKVLFSADAFGKFGVFDADEPWEDEARRYYIGIVGKYGMQVQALLSKIRALDIEIICSLHGPILKENLHHYCDLYHTWSSYGIEMDGIMIAYTSIYGNTKKAVEYLVEQLRKKGCENVEVWDLARTDMTGAIAKAFRYGKLVLATTTYNATVFPDMKEFLDHLTARNFQNRTVGLIENGSWAPMAAKVMKEKLGGCKNITWLENTVLIRSAMNEENKEQLEAMAEELCRN